MVLEGPSTPGTRAASRLAAGRRGDYGTERAAAAETVARLSGVRNVWNDIEISYGIDPVDADLHVQEAWAARRWSRTAA